MTRSDLNECRQWRRTRGLFTLDILLSLSLALVLLMAMSVVIVKQGQAEKRLAGVRAATREVESALLAMQAGGEPPAGVKVETVDGTAPAGYRWVKVIVPTTTDKPGASLVGMVRKTGGVAK